MGAERAWGIIALTSQRSQQCPFTGAVHAYTRDRIQGFGCICNGLLRKTGRAGHVEQPGEKMDQGFGINRWQVHTYSFFY